MNINNIINMVSSGAEAADDYSLLLEYRISHYPSLPYTDTRDR